MSTFQYEYFSEQEFNSLTPACSLDDMSHEFMMRLDNARRIANIPFRLSCAYRPRSWDLAKNRSGNSYHCSGRAVDIRCCNSKERFQIVSGLIKAGLTGIGIYTTWIHVDDRVGELMYISYV